MPKVMTGKQRNIAIITMIPLFLGIIIGYTINSSEAQMLKPTHPDIKQYQLSPKSYGSANSQVCGDRLCDELAADASPAFDVEENDKVMLIDQHDKTTPTTKLIDIRKYKPSTNKADAITFIITYSVTAGTERLENIEVHVKSDITEATYPIGSLDSFKTSVNVVRIKALDADSIDGGIVSYNVAPPTYNPRDPNR